ncbi:MAG: hypothetical protein R3Y56_03050 [Akkermansia sp.]
MQGTLKGLYEIFGALENTIADFSKKNKTEMEACREAIRRARAEELNYHHKAYEKGETILKDFTSDKTSETWLRFINNEDIPERLKSKVGYDDYRAAERSHYDRLINRISESCLDSIAQLVQSGNEKLAAYNVHDCLKNMSFITNEEEFFSELDAQCNRCRLDNDSISKFNQYCKVSEILTKLEHTWRDKLSWFGCKDTVSDKESQGYIGCANGKMREKVKNYYESQFKREFKNAYQSAQDSRNNSIRKALKSALDAFTAMKEKAISEGELESKKIGDFSKSLRDIKSLIETARIQLK